MLVNVARLAHSIRRVFQLLVDRLELRRRRKRPRGRHRQCAPNARLLRRPQVVVQLPHRLHT